MRPRNSDSVTLAQVLDVAGLAYLIAIYAVFLLTFILAYMSPAKAVWVRIDNFGEANAELVIFLLIGIPLIVRFAVRSFLVIREKRMP